MKTILCTECPHCKEEIELTIGNKILIGEEGKTNCPACQEPIEYEIRVLTTISHQTNETQGAYE